MNTANQAPVVMVDDSRADREIARICYQMSGLELPWREVDGADAFLDYAKKVARGDEPCPAVVSWTSICRP